MSFLLLLCAIFTFWQYLSKDMCCTQDCWSLKIVDIMDFSCIGLYRSINYPVVVTMPGMTSTFLFQILDTQSGDLCKSFYLSSLWSFPGCYSHSVCHIFENTPICLLLYYQFWLIRSICDVSICDDWWISQDSCQFILYYPFRLVLVPSSLMMSWLHICLGKLRTYLIVCA